MALEGILAAFESLPAFRRLIAELPGLGERRAIGGLAGSTDAVLVASLAARLPRRLVAVVTDTVSDAERWLADLQVLIGDQGVALYPPREGFGEVEPHTEIAGERVETLERLMRSDVHILLTTSRAVMERSHVPRALVASRLELRKGDVRRPEDLAAHLERIGFTRVPMVDDVAQFSVRGGIVDVYGFGMTDPVRMEFWGDEITDLRHFDLLTQRSVREAELALILPAEAAASSEEGVERRSLVELWPPDTLLVLPDESHIEPEVTRTWEEAAHHVEVARRRGEDSPERELLFDPPSTLLGALRRFARVSMADPQAERDVLVFPVREPESIGRDIKLLRRVVREGTPTVILCDNTGQAERLEELLNEGEWSPSPAAITIGVLNGGFILPPGLRSAESRVTSHESPGFGDEPRVAGQDARGLRVLTDHEIFRRDRRLRRTRRYGSGVALETVTGLKSGDFVVHLEHGVGIYRGIEKIFVRESVVEVAVIEYEGGDRLNVPLYRLDQVERYRAAPTAGDDTPPPRLHKLGGRRWKQQRDRTQSAINQMTEELLQLYARRSLASRPPHVPDTAWQKQLESSFLFEDTPDQRKATDDVKRDLERPEPMDRLLIGDVGYGKTEVAVRAAFKAIQSGRQVAVLVPTTILAEQHARTFGDRLADFPVRVSTLSRFLTASEQAKVVDGLGDGTIDVIIGTHRLLSKDVRFKALGLIVVDEEHRFGVKHKERLKELRLRPTCSRWTATPIPRRRTRAWPACAT
jgi:transcription-repair coupling factor (superfamily II helicase)